MYVPFCMSLCYYIQDAYCHVCIVYIGINNTIISSFLENIIFIYFFQCLIFYKTDRQTIIEKAMQNLFNIIRFKKPYRIAFARQDEFFANFFSQLREAKM